MVDITKEEFWDSTYEEVKKEKARKSKVKKFIQNHKMVTLLLSMFMILTITNIVLVYNFFAILKSIKL